MIIYEGEKYACLNCIRGHRSSTCDHKDRPLLQVRKRGRPQNNGTVRTAIIPDSECQCTATEDGNILIDPGHHSKQLVETKDGKVKVLGSGKPQHHHTPARLKVKKRTETEDEMYIPVGNGLYRKVSRSAFQKQQRESAVLAEFAKVKDQSPLFIGPMSMDGQAANTKDTANKIEEEETICCSKKNSTEVDNAKSFTNNNNEINHPDNVTQAGYSIVEPGYNDLGGSFDSFLDLDTLAIDQDLYYAPSCVLGQCECGDGCSCEGCPDHDPARMAQDNNAVTTAASLNEHSSKDGGLISLPMDGSMPLAAPAAVQVLPVIPTLDNSPYCPFGKKDHIQHQIIEGPDADFDGVTVIHEMANRATEEYIAAFATNQQ
ncbi:hypothetical protein TRVA0_010S00188 [Trichomonascus vanleenenianus]|uniref:copper fist DNA-binding domain-containing protein n=1 Tax=Trichomonascus vanleenenianus TaxID=2268995 RepID=UPI003EC9F4D1